MSPSLTREGMIVGIALILAAISLLVVSALGLDLGLPTFIAGAATLIIVMLFRGFGAMEALKHISWGVLPLVAGLFVFVEALDRTGLLAFLSDQLRRGAQDAPALTAWASALVAGFGSNIANNLPVGLLSGAAIQIDSPPPLITDADPDRRRSRAESLGDRLARDDPLAGGATPRRRACERA